MQKAIIDTATRVIKRVTVDDQPSFDEKTESIVNLNEKVDLSGDYKKIEIDNKTISIATPEEIDIAGVDETIEAIKKDLKLKNLQKAIDDVLKDNSVPDSIKSYFQALKELK